ncbi:transcriptional regulator, MarR family (plasmid) [Ruegeria pomeroyi DSS-3]|jgi:DNA-binding MarR family transcriptional regulator|uniref:Transcriptional regulator, MarR family n=3 Tax=Ruegeria pomeroyi TaxID=89184 RepID=Q5LLB8_RUEPO|nr:MarR family transcriptional regulator [Ruegeria pomeroyi]AAV97583.1 transcriptional regulator, MarR family [Ruegeria pomeroyi DSS-3]NVK98133.1 MarR family transcriptional regulator [Ruegeria pomeroyi]NVL02684.1 MarR family transcriptional regulator [Ruegeria pomeroyi]HCE72126.1 MarR family transcriptional regulator [Ruegeria sp.]
MGEAATKSDRQQNQTRLWLNILRLHGLVFGDLNRQLLDETGLSLAKFDAMAQLARNPDGLSMGKLSGALKVTNGNVSGLVNRLIKDGMVVKAMSADDRRSFSAKLTDAGLTTFKQASEAHNRILAELLRAVSDQDMVEASAALRGILESMQTGASLD